MKIIAFEIEVEGVTSQQFAPHLRAESLKVLELFEKGIVREIYFDQSHCAVIILECSNLEEAESILKELPLVKNGLIHFDLRELNPYTGFSRLLN